MDVATDPGVIIAIEAAVAADPEVVALQEADLVQAASAALAEGLPCSISRQHGVTR